MKIAYQFIFSLLVIFYASCSVDKDQANRNEWAISVLPPSIRLDPVTNEIIEFSENNYVLSSVSNVLEKNWIFDGEKVALHSARGEYVSFQVVLSNLTDETITDIDIQIPGFKGEQINFEIAPELFLEWSVKVQTRHRAHRLTGHSPRLPTRPALQSHLARCPASRATCQ